MGPLNQRTQGYLKGLASRLPQGEIHGFLYSPNPPQGAGLGFPHPGPQPVLLKEGDGLHVQVPSTGVMLNTVNSRRAETGAVSAPPQSCSDRSLFPRVCEDWQEFF